MTTTKQADEIFRRWIDWQRIYHNRDTASFIHHVNQSYWANLVAECNKNEGLRRDVGNLFEADRQTGGIKNGKQTVNKLLNFIKLDITAFLNYAKEHHLFDAAPAQPLSSDLIDLIINEYTLLLKTIFYHEDKFVEGEYLFSVANHFFDYCFVDETHAEFYALLHREVDYPQARLIQSVLWRFLSAEGWRDWHADCLAFLKKESQAGKTIVYIAGGLDIYQLLTHGIYNIEVIDPVLFSQGQAGYYSEGWSWLIDSTHIGDELIVTDEVLLRRHHYESFDTFKAVVEGGDVVDITHAHITWMVYDRKSSARLGSVVFKRRFVQQSDFENDSTKTLLVSFNEMYMLSAPSYCGGWGIDAECLSDDTMIVVKQLQHPIHAIAFKRMARSYEVPFRFINLGGCVT